MNKRRIVTMLLVGMLSVLSAWAIVTYDGVAVVAAWIGDQDGGGFDLSNVADITATGTIQGEQLTSTDDIALAQTGLLTLDTDKDAYITAPTDDRIDIYDGNGLAVTVTNGNVGIGTASPAYALDVAGDIFATANLRFSNGGGVLSQNAMLVSSDDFSLKNIDASPGNMWFGSKGRFAVGLDNTGTYTNDSFEVYNDTGASTPALIVTNGNVGIGTATPGVALDVAGSITSTATITGEQLTSTDDIALAQTGLLTLDTDKDAYITAPTDDRIDIYDGNGLAVTVTNGNVGIGTATPSYALEVGGTVAFATDDFRQLQVNSSGSPIMVSDTPQIFWSDTTASSAKFKAVSDADILNFAADGSGGSTYTNILSLDGDTGNVGIGTASPTHALEVVSGSTVFADHSMLEASITEGDTQTFTQAGGFEVITNLDLSINDGDWTFHANTGMTCNVTARYTVSCNMSYSADGASELHCHFFTNGVAAVDASGNTIGWYRDTGASLTHGVVNAKRTLTIGANTYCDWRIDDVDAGDDIVTWDEVTFTYQRN